MHEGTQSSYILSTTLNRGVFRRVSKVSGNQSNDVTFELIIFLAELAQLSTRAKLCIL